MTICTYIHNRDRQGTTITISYLSAFALITTNKHIESDMKLFTAVIVVALFATKAASVTKVPASVIGNVDQDAVAISLGRERERDRAAEDNSASTNVSAQRS